MPLRAVPLRLHGQEILPGLLATLVALDHAELFGHWDGELVVVNRAFHLSVAFRLNSYIFVRVEIFCRQVVYRASRGTPTLRFTEWGQCIIFPRR